MIKVKLDIDFSIGNKYLSRWF